MYTVKPCIFSTTNGELTGYVISEDGTDIVNTDAFYVNLYLHKMAVGSDETAKQYAYKICRFMNYLELRDKTVTSCTDKDLVNYLHSVQYDTQSTVVSIRQRISPAATAAFYYPVRGLFIYLHMLRVPISVTVDLIKSRKGKNAYLQGISPAMPSPDLVMDASYKKGAPARDYIKWYKPEEKDALINALRTTRDKAIFSIGCDGFRIDEILSSRMSDYDADTGVLTPYRSKRKADGSEMRSSVLSERSRALLEDYLLFERAEVEGYLLDKGMSVDDEIFIVLRRGENCGRPLGYRSYLRTLKTAAQKAGLDPARVRTHSGRSTRANEIVTDWSENPEKWTEREIMEVFGWSSMNSAAPYINRNDPRRQANIAKKLNELDKKMKERQAKKKRGDVDDG